MKWCTAWGEDWRATREGASLRSPKVAKIEIHMSETKRRWIPNSVAAFNYSPKEGEEEP